MLRTFSIVVLLVLTALYVRAIVVARLKRFRFVCALCGKRTSMPPHGTLSDTVYLSCCVGCAIDREQEWPKITCAEASDEVLTDAALSTPDEIRGHISAEVTRRLKTRGMKVA